MYTLVGLATMHQLTSIITLRTFFSATFILKNNSQKQIVMVFRILSISNRIPTTQILTQIYWEKLK